MPRPRNAVPTYRLHKPSGQAVVSLRRADGTREDVYLGAYNSPESKQEYERILAQVRSSSTGATALPLRAASDLTVNELLVAYLRHADGYYVHPDGTPTGEAGNMRDAIRPVTRYTATRSPSSSARSRSKRSGSQWLMRS